MWKGWLTSLRTRLIVSYIGLIVLGFGGLVILAGRQISASAQEDFAGNLKVKALLVAANLHEPVEYYHNGIEGKDELAVAMAALAEETEARITVIDLEGRGLVDSTGALPAEPLANSPEFLAARQSDVVFDVRESAAGVETLYTAAVITNEGKPLAVVRLALPVTAVSPLPLDLAGRNIEIQALRVAGGLQAPLAHIAVGASSEGLIQNELVRFAEENNIRVTLIDLDGNPWLDSTGELPVGNLGQTPEVTAAFLGQAGLDLRDDAEGNAKLYSSAGVLDDNRLLGIVRLSVAATQVQAQIFQRWLALGGGVALIGVLALLVSIWLSTSMTRPLLQLRNAALKLADGDLTQRVPEQRADELGKVSRAFNHMADEVTSMLKEQKAFASNVSHELRTPLTTMRLRTNLLRENSLEPAKAAKFVAEIDEEVIRLGGLVEDLILLSRFDAQRVEAGQERIDPIRFGRGLVQQFEEKTADRQLELTLDTPNYLPELRANANHVHVVFRNILDNAVKYTPAGGTIRWSLTQEGAYLHATIQDTGKGIKMEDLPNILRRFYRADKARGRNVPGSGLGLSLVQSIVSFYQGELRISSAGLGRGTQVDIWWPVAEPS